MTSVQPRCSACSAYAGPRPESEALPLRWEAVRKRTILFRATKRGAVYERATRLLAPLAKDLDRWREASGHPPDSALVLPNRAGEPWAEYDWDTWRERTFALLPQLPVFRPAMMTVHDGSGLETFARASPRS